MKTRNPDKYTTYSKPPYKSLQIENLDHQNRSRIGPDKSKTPCFLRFRRLPSSERAANCQMWTLPHHHLSILTPPRQNAPPSFQPPESNHHGPVGTIPSCFLPSSQTGTIECRRQANEAENKETMSRSRKCLRRGRKGTRKWKKEGEEGK